MRPRSAKKRCLTVNVRHPTRTVTSFLSAHTILAKIFAVVGDGSNEYTSRGRNMVAAIAVKAPTSDPTSSSTMPGPAFSKSARIVAAVSASKESGRIDGSIVEPLNYTDRRCRVAPSAPCREWYAIGRWRVVLTDRSRWRAVRERNRSRRRHRRLSTCCFRSASARS